LLFRQWSTELPEAIELVGLRLPGRDNRISERACTQWCELLDRLDAALQPVIDLPVVLFGYSMGAMIAYSLAQRLAARGLLPKAVIIAACRAPHVAPTQAAFSDLPQAEFQERLRSLGGIPDEVISVPGALELFEPMLRADLKLSETWSPRPGALAAPLVTIAGDRDIIAPAAAVAAWGQHGGAGHQHFELPGGHFFLHHHASTLRQIASVAATQEGTP
jgi:surfactin synthase thioesterase subunit